MSQTKEAAAQAPAVDPTDVPTVAVRELALAVKILSAGDGLKIPARELNDEDLRAVEQAFWNYSPRERTRKVAVLLRFRSLVEACRSRRVAAALADSGPGALVLALGYAASARLNTKYGLNPLWLARAITEGQTEGVPLAA